MPLPGTAGSRQAESAAPICRPVEYEDLRRAVQRTTGKPGFADMVIRFGHARPAATTARHPVADFIHKDQAR
jgi:hypothetical protein